MASLALALCFICSATAIAQPDSVVQSDSVPSTELVAVFLDCPSCDFDYIREEITWVNYARDRTDADVHVIGTTQPSAGGGRAYTLTFFGRRAFAGLADTLIYISAPGNTREQTRRELTDILKVGLLRYASRSSAVRRLRVDYDQVVLSGEAATTVRDPWKSWVFNMGASGSLSGQKSFGNSDISYSFSADRTTEAWKTNVRFSGSKNTSRFTLNDGSKLTDRSYNGDLNGTIVKSLGRHWSAGQVASVSLSSFYNQKLSVRFAPAIEYDIYPYSEATRRVFTFQYSAGVNHFKYEDTTLYDKLEETLGDHRVAFYLGIQQPWGSANASAEWAAYMSDLSKQHLTIAPSINIRVFRGLSVNVHGDLSLTRDQLYLPRTGQTNEEILLQRRALATSYSYSMGAGFSYFFGSKFNNVVNPRLKRL